MASLNKEKSQFYNGGKKKKERFTITKFLRILVTKQQVFQYTEQTWNRTRKYPGLLHFAFMFHALSLPKS